MKSFTGPAIMLLSVSGYALIQVLLKKAYKENIGPFTVMAISMFMLFAVSLALSIAFEGFTRFDFISKRNFVILLFAVGLINAAAFFLMIKAYDFMPLWQQQMFQIVTPVITGVLAFFILGEAMSLNLLFGLVFMAAGLFIAMR